MSTPFPLAAAAALLASLPTLAAQSPGFWEERPRLGLARQELGAAELGRELWVAGGLLQNQAATDTVERYDPIARRWTPAPAMPTVRHHFGMAEAGGKLYVIGGYVQGFLPDARCYCFDPGTQQWSRVADLPDARGALAAVEIGGLIYAVGGVAQGRGVVGDLTVYDPVNDRWQTLQPMPTAREHLAAAALGGQLYVAGGRRSGFLFDQLERYDPAGNRWQTLAPMPTARGGNGAAVLDGKLIVVGGEGSSLPGGNFPQAEEYDPQANTWRALRNLTVPVHGIYPVTIGDEIVVAGGGTRAGFAASDVVYAFRRLPTGVARYGSPTPECRGPMQIDPTSPPWPGNAQFALENTLGGPLSTNGVLIVGAAPNAAGTVVLGFRLHIGLAPPPVALPAATSALGTASVALPIPAAAAGARFFAQFAWLSTTNCPNLPNPLSGSDALDVTVRGGGG